MANLENPAFIQHENKVIETKEFDHVMALALNPKTGYKDGLIRCITKRIGDVQIRGYVDRSELYKVKAENLGKFEITQPLKIQGQDKVIKSLTKGTLDFIGLEDPDIWIDSETNLTHLYFTIPLRDSKKGYTYTFLGHAEGSDLDSLTMTDHVFANSKITRAKEVSIAPLNSKGTRLNLFESYEMIDNTYYSIIKVAEASNPSGNWKLKETVLHPLNQKYNWISGHASPGPLIPKEFIDLGPNKALGILNGREANQNINGKTKYGMFSVGLMIYDFEKGVIDWISEQPLIQDTEAKNITFASQFVQKDEKQGLLYAHVDDSFVRAYTLNSVGLKQLLA